jgi:hypothetical protein
VTQREVPRRHERVIRALQGGGPAVPATLQHRVDTVAAAERAPLLSLPRFGPVRAATAALASAAVVALVIGLAAGAGHGPGVDQLTAISERTATEPKPASDGTLLAREFEGVTFPDWSREFGWRPIGARTDTVDGRAADTVFYTHDGHVIGYTVLAGDTVDPPDNATTLTREGVTLHRFRDGYRDVVMFERNGRTCMLAGHTIHENTLPELAAWRGDGEIQF